MLLTLTSIMERYTLNQQFGQLFTHFWKFSLTHHVEPTRRLFRKNTLILSLHNIEHQLSQFSLIMANLPRPLHFCYPLAEFSCAASHRCYVSEVLLLKSVMTPSGYYHYQLQYYPSWFNTMPAADICADDVENGTFVHTLQLSN